MDLLTRQRNELATLKRHVENSPNSSHARFALGARLFETKQFSEAIAPLLKAIELDALWPVPPLYAGMSLFELGDFDASEKQLRTAESLGLAAEFAAQAAYYLGLIEEHRGHMEAARDEYLRACRLCPHYVPAQLTLTELCSKQSVVRPEGWQNPERDETFAYPRRKKSPMCRVRVFNHQHSKRQVILITNGRRSEGPSIVNAAERLVSELSTHLMLTVRENIWIMHFERGLIGPHALSRVTFGEIRASEDGPVLNDVRFEHLDSPAFFKMTGYNLGWND